MLVDVSLSTDSAIDDRRVLDVEKEALTALPPGWSLRRRARDPHLHLAPPRGWVSVRTVKDFEERSGRAGSSAASGRCGRAHYTRMGAAMRHVAARLETRPHGHRLLLLLTDGKPNDIDHYEGRYAIEDTRMAIREARRRGLKVFGITVDEQAQDYFPYLFGRGAYAIFPHIARLTSALPAIYRQLAA